MPLTICVGPCNETQDSSVLINAYCGLVLGIDSILIGESTAFCESHQLWFRFQEKLSDQATELRIAFAISDL